MDTTLESFHFRGFRGFERSQLNAKLAETAILHRFRVIVHTPTGYRTKVHTPEAEVLGQHLSRKHIKALNRNLRHFVIGLETLLEIGSFPPDQNQCCDAANEQHRDAGQKNN